LDGEAVRQGVPGPIWQKIEALYQQHKKQSIS
jgi:hypothetical protein